MRTVCRDCNQPQSNVGRGLHESDRAYTIREGRCRACAAKKRVRAATAQEGSK